MNPTIPHTGQIYSSIQRDLFLLKIAEEKKRKQKLLLDKQQYIKEGKKSNAFLDDVRQNYATYYYAMIQEKQKQMEAVKAIMSHLETLEKANQKADDEIDVIRHDKRLISDEMSTIQNELDLLIEKTK